MFIVITLFFIYWRDINKYYSYAFIVCHWTRQPPQKSTWLRCKHKVMPLLKLTLQKMFWESKWKKGKHLQTIMVIYHHSGHQCCSFSLTKIDGHQCWQLLLAINICYCHWPLTSTIVVGHWYWKSSLAVNMDHCHLPSMLYIIFGCWPSTLTIVMGHRSWVIIIVMIIESTAYFAVDHLLLIFMYYTFILKSRK